MDAGAILEFILGYVATGIGVFLLYSPVIVLLVVLLMAAGLLKLLLWPFSILLRKWRRRKRGSEPPTDGSWLFM